MKPSKKLISMFYYSTLYLITCTLWLSVQGHKSYLLHKRVDIKKHHIVTHHIYLYLINPTKYLLWHQISIHLNQSFTCSRYQLWTNQTYLQECDRNTKKCPAASVRKSHHWWRFSVAFHTVRSFASHHKLSY